MSAVPGVGLRISVRDGHVIVALRGELDVSTVADILPALTVQAGMGARLVVDLAELTFLDCGALSQLLSARAQARRAGGELALASPQPIVLRLLLLTDTVSQCPVFASVHDAVSSARADPQDLGLLA